MKRLGILTGIALLVVVMIAACTSTNNSSSPTSASFPTGNFVNGDWSWEFKTDGTFTSSGPLGSESGTYIASGDQIVITCQCCGAVEGKYSWSFDGTELKFNAIEDQCANRKDVVDASTWSKQ